MNRLRAKFSVVGCLQIKSRAYINRKDMDVWAGCVQWTIHNGSGKSTFHCRSKFHGLTKWTKSHVSLLLK